MDEVRILNDFDVTLSAARRGDKAGVERLIAEHQQYLAMLARVELGTISRRTVSESDIVQQTLIDISQGVEGFRGQSRVEFSSWLKKLVINNILDVVKRFRSTRRSGMSREVSLETWGQEFRTRDQAQLSTTANSPCSVAVRKETEFALEAALQRLKSRHRATIYMRHQDCYTFAEIGERLGCTEEAARKVWARAISLLKNELLLDMEELCEK